MKPTIFLIFIFSLSFANIVKAQTKNPKDTVSTAYHSPKKAVVLSAIIPGAGQVYNKKYWKLPVIYALGGYFIYNVSINNSKFLSFRDGFRLLSDSSKGITSLYINNQEYSALQCKSNRDLFKRQRDLNIFATVLVYALNLIDANVDGHFYKFEMNNDISLMMKPSIFQFNQNNYIGLIINCHLIK